VESDLAEAASLPEAAGRELFELAAAVERLSLRRESLGSSLGRSRQELSEAEALEQSGAPSYQEIEKAEARAAARERELAQECDRACERARHAAERLSVLERSIKEREGIPPAARALAEAGELLALTLLEVEPGYEQAVAAALAWRAAASDRAGSKARLRFAGEGRAGRGWATGRCARLRRCLRPGQARSEGSGAAGGRPSARRARRGRQEGAEAARRHLAGAARAPYRGSLGRRRHARGHGYDATRGELWFSGSATETLMLELDVRHRALEGEVKQLFGEAAEAEKALGRAGVS